MLYPLYHAEFSTMVASSDALRCAMYLLYFDTSGMNLVVTTSIWTGEPHGSYICVDEPRDGSKVDQGPSHPGLLTSGDSSVETGLTGDAAD